jgi:hypothetical protein
MQPALLAPVPPWLPELLQTLADRDVLSRPQLAVLVGRPRAELDPVVADLIVRGHIGQLVGDVTRETGLKLTRKGARYLAELTGAEAPPVRAVRATTMLAHELMTNDLAVVLKLLDDRGLVKLLRWETARDVLADAVRVLRGSNKSERIPLVADALVVLATQAGPTALLVEVDLGTVAQRAWRRSTRATPPGGVVAGRSAASASAAFACSRSRSTRPRGASPRCRNRRGRGTDAHGLLWFASSDVLNVDAPETLLTPRFVTADPNAAPRPLLPAAATR